MKIRVKITACIIFPVTLLSGCNEHKKKTLAISNVEPTAATIEWTSYGIPHIKADNYTDLGEGLGYVMAKDRLCNYVEGMITAKGERAKYLGAGVNDYNINSDFAYHHLGTSAQAQQQFSQLDSRSQELIQGFTKGFNYWLSTTTAYPEECASMVKPIDHLDLYTLNLSMNYWPFIGNYLQEIALAQPNTFTNPASIINKQFSIAEKMKGSNGWALGKEMTASGKGMLLSNTHLPHTGQYAWYEAHLNIPGELNIYGGFLPGFFTPALGFNESLAWTHTWTASTPGSFYFLTPSADNMLAYQYGEETRALTASDYEIQVKNSDNTLTSISRTLYASHYGPIVLFNENGSFVSAKDAPSTNSNQVDYWLKLALSNNVEEAISLNQQGYRTGSQNIIMTDENGDTFYADLAAVPHLSDAAWSKINDDAQLKAANGRYLDGADPIFEWEELVPFEKIPQRQSHYYVQNSNETAWLANLDTPILAYPVLYGRTDKIQSPRTRLSLSLLDEFKVTEKKLALQDLQNVMANKRLFLAEHIVDSLITRCRLSPQVSINETLVNLTEACDTLSTWDKKANLSSVGTHLFREYALNIFERLYLGNCDGECWQIPFDVNSPVNTPSGLPELVDGNNDLHLSALASAVLVIQQAGLELNSPLSAFQYLVKGDQSQVIAGGYGDLTGSFSTVNASTVQARNYYSDTGLSDTGYNIDTGDSFIFVAEFNTQGVTAKSVLLYSQSNNPESPHYFDQAALINPSNYKTVKFTQQSITDDPNYQMETIKIE